MPGFISAVIGLLLIAPPFRGLARHGVQRATERQVSAAVAGDLFGPRLVRVRRGAPTDGPAVVSDPESADPASPPTEIVEGEIVDEGGSS